VTVLVLRALGIGDLVTAVPALRGLHTAFPGEPLALLAPAWLRPLVELTGAVDQLLPLAGLGDVPPRVAPPAVAVNLHGRGPQSHRLLGALHPARLLGFRGPGCPYGPLWSPDEHEVARWCRMLGWYGIRCDRGDLGLRVPPHPPVRGASIVHPGAKAPRRRWPPERFAEVTRRLHEEGHHVVVTGSTGERALALRITRLAGLPDDRVLAGRTHVGELAGLVATARLVVCGDTGVGHLATAYATPSVLLFGPVPPRLWGPTTCRPQHVVLWHGPARHAGTPDPALLAITVDEVLDAVARVCGLQNVP
jgi:ADP-heptose:LPS heptosyltransferase